MHCPVRSVEQGEDSRKTDRHRALTYWEGDCIILRDFFRASEAHVV